MEKVTLELETVTPLFIAGADQRNIENEGLRPPSLRGLLRWWFRAIAGGFLDSVNALKIKENELFGSTIKKSAVNIIMKENDVKRDTFNNIMNNVIKFGGKDLGQRYLWFSMTYGGNERREVYLPRSSFTLTICSDNKDKLNLALGALWCVIYLGGIGTRSRRGAGNLRVTSPERVNKLDFVFKGNTINEAKDFIETNLKNIFTQYSDFCEGTGQINGICILKKGFSEISLVNVEFNDFKDALSYIGRKYLEYRVSLRPPRKRYILGLPIIRGKGLSPLEYKGEKLYALRQSSPLFFGVMDLNGKYAIRITKFLTSIHFKFKKDQEWVKHHLKDFDSNMNEIQVSIPEVTTK